MIVKKEISKILLILLSVFLLYSCGSAPRFTSKNDPGERTFGTRTHKSDKKDNIKPLDVTKFRNVSVLKTETGIASYYADKFNGKLTSNGEIYDMFGLTAAHPAYPEGTIVRVTKLSDNKSIIIRINDRMPVHPDRVIDLSYGSAEELGMLDEGIAKVKIEVLEWGDGKYKNY